MRSHVKQSITLELPRDVVAGLRFMAGQVNEDLPKYLVDLLTRASAGYVDSDAANSDRGDRT